MKKYHKIKCLQGLIIGLDENIYKQIQSKNNTPENEEILINSYYSSIKDLLNEEE